MQNGENRTLLLPMIYDFHQLMKAKKNKPSFQNYITQTHHSLNNLISNYVPFIAEINAAVT